MKIILASQSPMRKELLKQISESYRKIRNTLRFLLANVFDFDPAVDYVQYEVLKNIDKFAMVRNSDEANDVKVNRQAITSYPDKVFAYKIDAQNGAIDFDIELVIPYLGERALDDGGRTGDDHLGTLRQQNRLLIHAADMDGSFVQGNALIKDIQLRITKKGFCKQYSLPLSP